MPGNDVLQFGGRAATGPRRWPWVLAVLVLLVGIYAVVLRQGSRQEAVETTRSTSPRSVFKPRVTIAGTGYDDSDDGALAYSIAMYNPNQVELTLSQAFAEELPGVTILGTGFVLAPDTSAAIAPSVTVGPGGRVRFVVRYRVNCARIDSRWPYLGVLSASMAMDGEVALTELRSAVDHSAGPSTPPCPMLVRR